MKDQQSSAHDFLHTHLIPNYEKWEKNSHDLRLAMNAVLSLFHMADYFWHSFKESDPGLVFEEIGIRGFRRELVNNCVEFGLLRDVAEAHKHMELDRNNKKVSSSKQTVIGQTGYGEGGYGSGPYGGGPSIIINLDNGTKRHLCDIMGVVRKYWHDKLLYCSGL